MSSQAVLTSLSKRFHFTPLSSLSKAPRKADDPKLIFLFSWMGAKIPHVQKYINGYSSIWPSTPIIVVQSFAQDFRPFSSYGREFGQLMTLVAQYDVDMTSKTGRNDVLMVVMSNGGCFSAKAFLDTFSTTQTLHPRVMIHDSCPGLARYRNTLNAFLIAGKYRLFSKALATIVITIYYLLARTLALTVGNDTLAQTRKAMIEQIRPKRRVYIYSKTDALIDYRDVEAHATDARKASNEVTLEMFDGSAHVMHLRADEQRYWKIVQDAWNPSTGSAKIQAAEAAPSTSSNSLDDSYIEAKAIPSGTTSLNSSYNLASVPPLSQSQREVPVPKHDDESLPASNQNNTENQEETSSQADSEADEAELDPSILGTKAYWDKFYEREYGNYSETLDEGEIWFGEESEGRIIRYLEATFPSPSSSSSLPAQRSVSSSSSTASSLRRKPSLPAAPKILDLGTGNGHLLFAIHESGFQTSVMKGIDYSAASINLATSIANTRGLQNVSFQVCDFLHDDAAAKETYNVVLDKGTFDAISLSSEKTSSGEKLWTLYAASVARYMTRDSKLVITSCNWTKEELVAKLTGDGILVVHAYFKEPKKTFTFGGKSGSTTSQVVFRLA